MCFWHNSKWKFNHKTQSTLSNICPQPYIHAYVHIYQTYVGSKTFALTRTFHFLEHFATILLCTWRKPLEKCTSSPFISFYFSLFLFLCLHLQYFTCVLPSWLGKLLKFLQTRSSQTLVVAMVRSRRKHLTQPLVAKQITVNWCANLLKCKSFAG